jgi:hypothetical protein
MANQRPYCREHYLIKKMLRRAAILKVSRVTTVL